MNQSERTKERLMTAARRVRQRRQELGETAEALARRAGVPPGCVEALEAGAPGALPLDQVFDLCAALSIRPADLFEP